MTTMTLEERYRILIDARNFHYDNFSKWMTYFYVAIGALFVGYCTILSSEKTQPMLEYLFPVLGFVVSLLWYWSAKGYYYWNINFINLVNYYEKDLLKFDEKERVYFVFANKKIQNNYGSPISGANISTSKIAILFAFIVTAFWGFIFYNKVFTDNFCNCCCSLLLQIILSLTTVLVLSYLIPISLLKSKHDHFPDLKLQID
jgi:hypothetical protein